MKNNLVISNGAVQLMSRTDDGTNTFYINGSLIPSSSWVGTGAYTYSNGGGTFTFTKIDSLDGNVMLKQIDDTTFEFDVIKDTAATIAELSEQVNQLATVTKANVTSFQSGWDVYNNQNNPVVKKQGSVVYLQGVMTNTQAVTLNTSSTWVASLPPGYAPNETVYALCQGSGGAKYLLSVTSGGNIFFARYTQDGNTWPQIASGTWFPFSLSWIVG